MFREMRRKKQLLDTTTVTEILENGKTGILAVIGDDDYPYTIPLNYAYEDGKIYFHCAKDGHKIDAIRKNSKVSFCVVDDDKVVPEKFTTFFRSVVAFGKASVVESDSEKLRIIRLLNQKYAPGFDEAGEKEIEGAWKVLCTVQIDVEHMTGKEAIELVKKHS